MSRYLGLKKSFEDIKRRASTKTEKSLLKSLVLIMKAYDSNYLEFSDARARLTNAYGVVGFYPACDPDFIKALGNVPEGCNPYQYRKDMNLFWELWRIEHFLYSISKKVRSGIGLDLKTRQIPNDGIKREHIKPKRQNRKAFYDATRKN